MGGGGGVVGNGEEGRTGVRERMIATEYGQLWTGVVGEGRPGTPVLVIHGGPGFMTMTDVVADLAGERPVYFYDQLGSGRSDRAASAEVYTPGHFVAELGNVLRALGLTEVVLLGFSWGAALATTYALEQPGAVRGLILSGPLLSTARWDADQRANIRAMPAEVARAIAEGERTQEFGEEYQAAMMRYYERFVCRLDPWPDSLNEAFGQLNMDVYLSLWGPSEFTVTGQLGDLDLFPRLSELAVPVLLTCGDRDEAGVGTLKDAQLALPHGQLAVVPRATHMHHLEQPAIYLAVVEQFLRDLP